MFLSSNASGKLVYGQQLPSPGYKEQYLKYWCKLVKPNKNIDINVPLIFRPVSEVSSRYSTVFRKTENCFEKCNILLC